MERASQREEENGGGGCFGLLLGLGYFGHGLFSLDHHSTSDGPSWPSFPFFVLRPPARQNAAAARFSDLLLASGRLKTPWGVEICSGSSWGSCPTMLYGWLRHWLAIYPTFLSGK